MTASSYHSSDYYPHYGRLHGTRGGGAWCQETQDTGDYLQVDMGAQHAVCAVATQGAPVSVMPMLSEWYKLSVSRDGVTWSFYQENNATKVIVSDRTSFSL